ncbi:MAG: RNA 2',3'-cyclic phosphodiesterase [Phycisphaeraceae bacterium]|nr:MAG: RNA 2',3'-cyclic phosphodiesterase [Phycisphaeraceae bacterium]
MGATSRIFIAAPLDDACRAALERLDRWLDHLPTHRSVPTAQRHLTVAFIGAISEAETQAVIEALGEPCRWSWPEEATLTPLMAIPSLRRPRVLAAGLDDPGNLSRLMEDTARAVAEAAPTESILRGLDRPALPHITVARVRGSRPPRPISLDTAPRPDGVLKLTCLNVVRSTLTPRGPDYCTLASIPIQCNLQP